MNKLVSISAVFLLSLFFSGCGKKKGCTNINSINYDADAEKDDGSCGEAILIAYPQHHGAAIAGLSTYPDSAFVKYNATNSPGSNPSAYDKIFVGLPGDTFVTITGLAKGPYFIMMAGFDTAVNQRVTGGIPHSLSSSSGETSLVVPVTE